MSRIFRFTLLSILILFTFACGLISNPLNQAKGSGIHCGSDRNFQSSFNSRGTAILHAAIHAGGYAFFNAGGREIS